MVRYFAVFGLVATVLTGMMSPMADAGPSAASGQSNYKSNFMRVYGSAHAPYGFVRFCEANDSQCASTGFREERFDANPQRLAELDAVNRYVNTTIEPKTDEEIYGISEYWTLPTTVGDCEDYALLKRQILIERGWPASALLLTVVRDEIGDGHAILTVRSAQGDFVLDNKIPDVRIWNATPYEFVMRQSYVNPRSWVSLDAAYTDVPAEMAGAQAR